MRGTGPVATPMTEPEERAETGDPVAQAAMDWFLRLQSQELTAEERAGLAAWLDADPGHRAGFEEVRLLWGDLGALEPELQEAPRASAHPAATLPQARERPSVSAAGAAKRRRPSKMVLRPRRRLRAGWSAALGALAVACLLALVFAPDLAVRLQADFRTSVGEQAKVLLPDGSLVHLNSGSAIALDFGSERRRVTLLAGEAFFEVAPDRTRPFDVLALAGQTTALGTAFAVRDRGERAEVSVAEGRVRVTSPADAPGGEGTGLTLRPGQVATYRTDAPPQQLPRVEPSRIAAWRRGTIIIDGLALPAALEEIDRYRPGRILLLAESVRWEKVSARLSIADIDDGLKTLAAMQGLRITEIGDLLTILR